MYKLSFYILRILYHVYKIHSSDSLNFSRLSLHDFQTQFKTGSYAGSGRHSLFPSKESNGLHPGQPDTEPDKQMDRGNHKTNFPPASLSHIVRTKENRRYTTTIMCKEGRTVRQCTKEDKHAEHRCSGCHKDRTKCTEQRHDMRAMHHVILIFRKYAASCAAWNKMKSPLSHRYISTAKNLFVLSSWTAEKYDYPQSYTQVCG